MANIARRRVARELVRLLTEQPQRKAELLKQTAAYLLQTKQVSQSHLLLADMADELLRTQHHLSAEVRSAFVLSSGSRQAIIDMLKRHTGAKTVELDEQVEPSLIGGIVIRTPGQELDASVKRQLTQLAGGTK